MTKKELIEYLKQFQDDAELSILIANPKERLIHHVKGFACLQDKEIPYPVFCIEVGNAENMDEEMVKACEEEEQQR